MLLIIDFHDWILLRLIIHKIHAHNKENVKALFLYAFHQLEKSGLLCEPNKTGSCHFHVSDHTEGFSNIAEIFLGRNVQADVEHVEIEDF